MVDSDDYSYRGLAAVYDQKLRGSLTAKMDGLLERHPMIKAVNWKEVAALASMPSREELLAMLVGTLQAPIVKLVRTMNEVPGRFVRTLAAVQAAKEKAAT